MVPFFSSFRFLHPLRQQCRTFLAMNSRFINGCVVLIHVKIWVADLGVVEMTTLCYFLPPTSVQISKSLFGLKIRFANTIENKSDDIVSDNMHYTTLLRAKTV